MSWLGTPFSSLRKPRSNGSFAFANAAMSIAFWPPHQHRAQRNHQQIVEVMQRGIPGSRVLQTFPARTKFFQCGLPGRVSQPMGRIDPLRAGQAGIGGQGNSKCDSPEHGSAVWAKTPIRGDFAPHGFWEGRADEPPCFRYDGASIRQLPPVHCATRSQFDIRLISLTLAADIFSSRAVSRTPRPSSSARRTRSILIGAIGGLPSRVPDDRGSIQTGHTRSRIMARSNSAEHRQHPEQASDRMAVCGVEGLLVQIQVNVAGSKLTQQTDQVGQ